MFDTNIQKIFNLGRKRKIKCDGLKPACKNCVKASYMCIWPDGKKSLPHKSDFKLMKVKNKYPKSNFKLSTYQSNNLIVETEDNEINLEIAEAQTGTYGDFSDITENLPTLNISEDGEVDDSLLNSPNILSEQVKTEELLGNNSNAMILTDSFEIKRKALSQFTKKYSDEEIKEDALFRKFLSEVILNASLSGYKTWLPGADLTIHDAYLYDAFIHGFMVSISPQLAHIKLQPGSVFVPPGVNNSVLRSLFIACGSSFISHVTKNEEMKELSFRKCDQSILKITEYMEKYDLSGTEDWILIFLLLYCLKQKFSDNDGNMTQTLNIIAAIETVKLWLLIKKNKSKDKFGKIREVKDNLGDDESFVSLDGEIIYPPQKLNKVQMFTNIFKRMKNLITQNENNAENNVTGILEDKFQTSNQSFSVDLINVEKILPIHEFNQSHIDISPFERTILESFAFNYSNSLFTCNQEFLKDLTSPFEIFDSLRPYLYTPLYECAVPWMNNPVVGAALPVLELQAKLNWLALQLPLSNENRQKAERILKIAKYYTHPILPLKVYQKEPENVQRRLMESCYASGALAKAVTIFAMKLLNPELSSAETEVQSEIFTAFSYLTKLSLHSQVSVIMNWTMVIFGSAVIDCNAKDYLIWRIQNFSNAHKLKSFNSIIKFLEIAWDENLIPGRGWDVLLDRESVCSLIL